MEGAAKEFDEACEMRLQGLHELIRKLQHEIETTEALWRVHKSLHINAKLAEERKG